jgi:hypothetical protein
MKKLLLTLLAGSITLISYSQTAVDIQKAKAACAAYLKRNLNNPMSYKPASWGKLSKTQTTFYESKVSKLLNDSLEYYNEGQRKISDKMHKIRMASILKYHNDSTYLHYADLLRQVDSAILTINSQLIAKENLFKPVFDGYIIEHSFRARNKFNALVLQKYQFLLSKSFKVTSAADLEEMEREREDLQRRIDELTKGN